VIALTWPMIFANALIPLVGVIDTAVIGLSGDATDIGGVAVGGMVFAVFYWSTYFLRMGVTGLTAQAIGSGDEAESQRIVARALLIALVLGFLFLALKTPISALAFNILQGSEAVETKGAAYVTARFWGAPAALGLFAVTGWLIGAGKTRLALMVQMVLALTNGALDVWFVMGLGWGPAGVAAGTAIAEWLAFLLGLTLVLRAFGVSRALLVETLSLAQLIDPAALKRLFGLNFNLFLRSIFLTIGFSWFINAGARQGDVLLAANQVLLQFIMVWAFVLDAFAYTAEAETGRAFGQRSITDLRRAVRLTSEFAFACAFGFGALTLFGGGWVIGHLISDQSVREAAIVYLPWCAAVPVLGIASWQLDGIFTGATRSAAMRNASLASLLVYLGFDALLSPGGNGGAWAAFLIYFVARGLSLLVAYPALERGITKPA
jgi:MATE family multidrug resistance protein